MQFNRYIRARAHTQVEGAGTKWCNGIYRISPESARNVPLSAYREIATRIGPSRPSGPSTAEEEDVPKYTYQASRGPLMTLFRCKMRTKAYWWFIRWVVDPLRCRALRATVCRFIYTCQVLISVRVACRVSRGVDVSKPCHGDVGTVVTRSAGDAFVAIELLRSPSLKRFCKTCTRYSCAVLAHGSERTKEVQEGLTRAS